MGIREPKHPTGAVSMGIREPKHPTGAVRDAWALGLGAGGGATARRRRLALRLLRCARSGAHTRRGAPTLARPCFCVTKASAGVAGAAATCRFCARADVAPRACMQMYLLTDQSAYCDALVLQSVRHTASCPSKPPQSSTPFPPPTPHARKRSCYPIMLLMVLLSLVSELAAYRFLLIERSIYTQLTKQRDLSSADAVASLARRASVAEWLVFLSNIANTTAAIGVPWAVIYNTKAEPAEAIVLILLACILWMKLVSYHHVCWDLRRCRRAAGYAFVEATGAETAGSRQVGPFEMRARPDHMHMHTCTHARPDH
eukprot:354506-Chlamydomonas_euryale.AAC.1